MKKRGPKRPRLLAVRLSGYRAIGLFGYPVIWLSAEEARRQPGHGEPLDPDLERRRGIRIAVCGMRPQREKFADAVRLFGRGSQLSHITCDLRAKSDGGIQRAVGVQ